MPHAEGGRGDHAPAAAAAAAGPGCDRPPACRVLRRDAAHDRLLPGRCQRHLSALLPAQATQWLDGPHLMLQARPEAAAGVIAAFMQDVCGSA